MWISLAIIIILLAVLIYEYRLRKPDQIVLYESNGIIKPRKSRFYPRHFSLAIPATVHSKILEIEAEAKGKIVMKINLSVSVAASTEHLPALIRVGGWNKDAVSNASKDFDVLLQALVKEFAGNVEIEELTSEKLSLFLDEKLGKNIDTLGLDILSLNVQSVDPAEESIAEAMRKRESARILEQTEAINQKARIAAQKAKIQADEEIAASEHELELKRLELKNAQEEREALIAERQIKEELKRKNMQFDFERKEIELLKDNPELLIFSPQAARLAEASQTLPNARTIVSLSPNDLSQGSELIGMLQAFFQNIIQKSKQKNEK